MRRVMSWFRVKFSACTDEEQARAVQAILMSHSLYEVLGLQSSPRGAGGSSSSESVALPVTHIDSMEAGVTILRSGDTISDDEVVMAFLKVVVDVHPACNRHTDAGLAFCWAADAFINLRTRALRENNLAVTWPRQNATPVGERECGTDMDSALSVFGEVMGVVLENLSLRDMSSSVDRTMSDTLLRAQHILHLRENGQDIEERRALDSALAISLFANGFLTGVFGIFKCRPRQTRATTTIMAIVGSVLFSFVSRLGRMVSDSGGNRPALGVLPSTPHVSCPLCREMTAAGRAIKGVRAGDMIPICCVCTEIKADVCLACGHLCLCQDCFSHLPRTLN